MHPIATLLVLRGYVLYTRIWDSVRKYAIIRSGFEGERCLLYPAVFTRPPAWAEGEIRVRLTDWVEYDWAAVDDFVWDALDDEKLAYLLGD